MATSSVKFDPIHSYNAGNRVCGANVNHASIPVLRNILSKSLAEFAPDIWADLEPYSLERAAAIQVYERVRSKVELDFRRIG